MKILFLTLVSLDTYERGNIYVDLMHEFIKNGHRVTTICPMDDSGGKFEEITSLGNKIFRVQAGQVVRNNNFVKKGLNTLFLAGKYKNAIKKHAAKENFDLILYSTPPITLLPVVRFAKKKYNARSYLMLKDIFPQNAVDIGLLKRTGWKGLVLKYFRRQERKLYEISDFIGCMSRANVDYVLQHNQEVDPKKIHVLPNAIDIQEFPTEEDSQKVKEKYGLPKDKKIFIYGGNLGAPQDIPYVIECLKANMYKKDRHFLVCGTGAYYDLLKSYAQIYKPKNFTLLNGLPHDQYQALERACDVGLIFLDYRFTIPNFPSRLLSYMESGLPVIALTDANTDVGAAINEGGFGWWAKSDCVENFTILIDKAGHVDLKEKGMNARTYLEKNYTVKRAYDIIVENLGRKAR